MRTPAIAASLAFTLIVGGAFGATTHQAVADPGDTPSQAQVDAAVSAVAGAADSVAGVRAALVVAEQNAQAAAEVAEQATEHYLGAKYLAEEAAKAAAAASVAADQAHVAVATQREAYADAIADTYTMSPSLSALSAITQADGISGVIESTASMHNAEHAMDAKYDDYRASSTIADASRTAARRALDAAAAAADEAESAQAAAAAAANGATAQAASMAAQRDALIAQLAQFQNVSIQLATQRQNGLEQQARHNAAAAAKAAAKKAGQATPLIDESIPLASSVTIPQYDALPTVPSGPAPPPGEGAVFAVAFARAQIGEPYVWAAAGPDAWDCSGLTMGAWGNGGKALPHYSVAQYAASTPINPADLQPGDLLFWGTTSSPGSIHHVALYVGNGMMIHAPRTGVPVQEVSMFYWIPPNFYARP